MGGPPNSIKEMSPLRRSSTVALQRIGRIARGQDVQEALDARVERHPRADLGACQAPRAPTPAELPPATS